MYTCHLLESFDVSHLLLGNYYNKIVLEQAF